MTYARGKHAYGFCDRTGFRYSLKDLVTEYVNGLPTGLRIGKDVVDTDHPQNFLHRVRVNDPKPLKDPRPDPTKEGLFGWNPDGNPGNVLRIGLGKVYVTIT